MQYEIEVKVLKIMGNETGVIQIYEHGTYEGFGFFVMEMMDGGTLLDLYLRPDEVSSKEGPNNAPSDGQR
jgi:serine/threonine protein kinase